MNQGKLRIAVAPILFFCGGALACPSPVTGQDVYKCAVLTDSAVKGAEEDRISMASYRLWIDSSNPQALCIEGKTGSPRTGNSYSLGESQLPQVSHAVGGTQNQTVTLGEDYWKISINGYMNGQKAEFPNTPQKYDEISLDRKNQKLEVAHPSGVKAFVAFRLKCVKE